MRRVQAVAGGEQGLLALQYCVGRYACGVIPRPMPRGGIHVVDIAEHTWALRNASQGAVGAVSKKRRMPACRGRAPRPRQDQAPKRPRVPARSVECHMPQRRGLFRKSPRAARPQQGAFQREAARTRVARAAIHWCGHPRDRRHDGRPDGASGSRVLHQVSVANSTPVASTIMDSRRRLRDQAAGAESPESSQSRKVVDCDLMHSHHSLAGEGSRRRHPKECDAIIVSRASQCA